LQQNADLRNLRWLLESPGLLQPSPKTPSSELVHDVELHNWAVTHAPFLNALAADATSLTQALESGKETRRLGRYLESMMEFAVRNVLKPELLIPNLPVRGEKRTLGELDLVFRAADYPVAQHWELSVKFYLCTATSLAESQEARFYMGTFVEDRLDRKLDHLFKDQLPLAKLPEAQSALSESGFAGPLQNRALMKGLFYYPSCTDWRTSPLPAEISPQHLRGWWTTSDLLEIPQTESETLYVQLGPLEWMAPYEREVSRANLLTHAELKQFVKAYFAGSMNEDWLRRRELTFAEVSIGARVSGETGVSGDIAAQETDRVYVREVSRGHFVHADWPKLARWAAGQTQDTLALSLKKHSKRPQG
jgi:uncharacterized protein